MGLGLVTCKLVLAMIFEASHGLHSHRVLCFGKCYVKQTVLLKISGQIFTSLKAQIFVVFFFFFFFFFCYFYLIRFFGCLHV